MMPACLIDCMLATNNFLKTLKGFLHFRGRHFTSMQIDKIPHNLKSLFVSPDCRLEDQIYSTDKKFKETSF